MYKFHGMNVDAKEDSVQHVSIQVSGLGDSLNTYYVSQVNN